MASSSSKVDTLPFDLSNIDIVDSQQQKLCGKAAKRQAEGRIQVFCGEWDEEGVYVYQAFNDAIADWALEHQQFGGPAFKPVRMTWVKPSFAWVLYRSGYARKHNQNRILKIKIGHENLASLLSTCQCKHAGGGAKGRVQWDPARDIMAGDDKGREPRKMQRERAIQIGFKADLSEFYVKSAISIEDVTDLAHEVEHAHKSDLKSKSNAAITALVQKLPVERPYMPLCAAEQLEALGMVPGERAEQLAGLGRGKVGS
jgi:hypothetical protein